MKEVLIVGGASGIGLSLALLLSEREDVKRVVVLDKQPFAEAYRTPKIESEIFDVADEDYSLLSRYTDCDALYITAGYGRLGMVQDFDDAYVRSILLVNAAGPIRLLRYFYDRLLGQKPFYCAVMCSIAAHVSSPMFAYYSATKGAIRMFVEAANVELEVQGSQNRILEVSPGSIKGTSFEGGVSDPLQTRELAAQIIEHSEQRERRFIPQYEEVFKGVVQRYQEDAQRFGIDSYWYKKNGRQHKK